MSDNPFVDALEWYETHDWVRGRTYAIDYNVPVITGACLTGVLGVVTDSVVPTSKGIQAFTDSRHDHRMEAHLFLEQVTAELYEMGVIMFNDWPDRTYDDIRPVLEKAAAKWEEQHG